MPERKVPSYTELAPAAELGRHDGALEAIAVLRDGRIVTGRRDARVLVCDPARRGPSPLSWAARRRRWLQHHSAEQDLVW
jgi:hypothetical protein